MTWFTRMHKYDPDQPRDEQGRWTDAQNAFMEQHVAESFANPLNDRERLVYAGGPNDGSSFAGVELSPWEKSIHLSSLIAMTPKKGQGTYVLKKLIEMADKHGVEITGTAKAFGNDKGRMSTAQLKKWYAKHGFKVNNKTGDMVYTPKKTD